MPLEAEEPSEQAGMPPQQRSQQAGVPEEEEPFQEGGLVAELVAEAPQLQLVGGVPPAPHTLEQPSLAAPGYSFLLLSPAQPASPPAAAAPSEASPPATQPARTQVVSPSPAVGTSPSPGQTQPSAYPAQPSPRGQSPPAPQPASWQQLTCQNLSTFFSATPTLSRWQSLFNSSGLWVSQHDFFHAALHAPGLVPCISGDILI